MKYRIVPITKTEARRFVTEHHRHNEAPSATQVQLAVGLEVDGELVAVATAGWPVARYQSDGRTLEVNRACVKEGDYRNANSALYGAIARAAKALGFERLITYTLHSESGASLKAAGFDGPFDIGANTWERPNRVRHDYNIWGERNNAAGVAKYRWERRLADSKAA